MAIEIIFSEDPAWVLSSAAGFLASQPVLHNLILTRLHRLAKGGEPGRYWVAMEGRITVGVVLHSPASYPAILTPAEPRVVAAMVDAIAEMGVRLPGVNADAATAASFAGQWAERSKSAATPLMGMRLYELFEMEDAPGTAGRLRPAIVDDRSVMIEWTRSFQEEIGESADDAELRVDRGLAARQMWVWDDGEAVSMAVNSEPVQDVVRVAGVYTPHDKRKRGYAEACVHALSKHLAGAGYRCILYTDLGNPTSNSIYQRIGYRAVAEWLRYHFA